MTILILIILAASAFYTPWRLKTLLGLKKIWLAQGLTFIFLAGFIATLMTGVYVTSSIGALLYNVFGLFLMAQSYLLFVLVFAHFFHKPLTRLIPGKILGRLFLLLTVALVVYGFVQAQSFTVTHFEIKVQNLSRPVTVMHIPDLHLGSQRGAGYLTKVLTEIEKYSPDIVIYNGDLADNNLILREEIFNLFKTVKAEQYYTTGNHEYYIDTDKVLALARGAGLKVLRSEMVQTHGLQLIGLEYMNADKAASDPHQVNNLTIEEELPKILRSRSRPTLLAHHSPVGLEYVKEGDIDVMLSGHTHGGQVFPGTLFIQLRFPYSKGLFNLGRTTLLVSQGAGTFGPWMRLGTFNEIQVVKLVP
ncbi:MAG: metallophosphoesterase [Deltaproteobacteria bacterium]|nr:metallophosphoesterase [Deltaproteobacteria bacterium]